MSENFGCMRKSWKKDESGKKSDGEVDGKERRDEERRWWRKRCAIPQRRKRKKNGR